MNPNGEMQYWDAGFPFQGIQNGSIDVGEMQYWDAGFPQNNYIPTTTPPVTGNYNFFIFFPH